MEDANYIAILEQNAEALVSRLQEERNKLRRVIIALAHQNGGTLFIPEVAMRGDEVFDVFPDEVKRGWTVTLRR
jgi:hypothetical protein